jgi:hypothetical protein
MLTRLTTFFACLIAINAFAEPQLDPAQDKWVKHYKKQANVPKAAADMKINTDKEPDLTAGFVEIFNGKDLTGWAPKGGKCTFEAKDGNLVGTCVKKSPSTYLCTEKADYTDFIFTCDMKWEVDGNTGVMFRAASKPGKKGDTVFGPQAEMEGFSKDRGWSGGIYGQSCGGWYYPLWLTSHKDARKALKKDEWNRLTIQAQGKTVKTWLNGVPAAHWETDEYLKGFFGLQINSGSAGTVLWRNVRVKELTK